MLATFLNICRTNIDNGASNSFGGGDNNVVVFGHLEGIKGFSGSRFIEDTGIDCFWDGIVDQFTEDQPIPDLVKELHRSGRDWNA